MITRKELIKKYINFFKEKGHKEIQNSPLIPQNDPTVLFTTAGMHPLVPYLLGQKHPQGKRLVNVQRCIRTGDIDEVGDAVHHTFFEMLGNWSLGDYFKEEAIEMSFEFLTKTLKIPIEKLAISVFGGDKDFPKVPKDNESAEIWKDLGIEHIAYLTGDNWWGPAGNTGPCGPDTEMFYYTPKGNPKEFDLNKSSKASDGKDWVEIWNDVLMQYNKDSKGDYKEAKQKNIDTGMGVERTLAVLNELKDNYESEVWKPIISKIEKISKKKYGDNKREMRIIADHLKASVFILAENISPSNKEHGYVLRRLIRRAITHAKRLMIQNNFTKILAEEVIKIYSDYSHLQKNKEFILKEIEKEENQFRQTLASGLKFFNKVIENVKNKTIAGKDAFLLYQSYGFPLEMTQELAKEKKLQVDMVGFEEEQAKHQELSRTASAGKFKSGLADHSEATTKLHTAAHLLLAALRQVLGEHVEQRGSNITAERLRFDFSHEEKLTQEQITQAEKIVNNNIKQGLEIKREELTLKEAKKSGAMGIFDDKYGDKVSVYTVCNPKDITSKEICAGPHVTNTKELGKFKIIKEESSSKGVRRIKAVLGG